MDHSAAVFTCLEYNHKVAAGRSTYSLGRHREWRASDSELPGVEQRYGGVMSMLLLYLHSAQQLT